MSDNHESQSAQDVLASLKNDVEEALGYGEDVHGMAKAVRNIYAESPPGSWQFGHLPGFLTGLLVVGVEEAYVDRGEIAEFITDVFEEAGLAGHPHIADILRFFDIIIEAG